MMKIFMKIEPMKKSPPFIKRLSASLALIMFQTSTAWAVSPVPGSLAVLEPSLPIPEMRAAWDGIRNEIYLDPLLLVKGHEEVSRKLSEWRLAADSIRAAYRTADRVTLDRTQALIEEAWAHYYQFDYHQAAQALSESEKLLSPPGDSGFRTRLMFDVLLLRGLVARAGKDKSYGSHFMKAAAIDPVRELSLQKYSPETINIYNRYRDELLAESRVSLFVEGTPADATVSIGDQVLKDIPPDTGHLALPGIHFLEASAPGYETWSMIFDAHRFEPARVNFKLVPTGPEGEPDSFFLQRLKAGDRSYLALLAEKLGVDYLLVPDPHENSLRAWLIDHEGRTVDHALLWEAEGKVGDADESGTQKAMAFLKPLRQRWDYERTSIDAPFSMPDNDFALPEESGDVDTSSGWNKYAIAIGLLILVGVAAGAEQGGDTRVEATW